ncbi:MAG TPA: TRAP transporter small permease subunit [Burkholderiaceae bacterium]|nr:TRAP transporter small permease subunit [Burkholderiaceae bacterium]
MTRWGDALLKACALPGRYGSALILILVLVVLAAVIGAQFGLSDLASWTTPIPLFGNHLNMTSIGELQWHIFSLLVMLSGAYALKEDRHVRVDVWSVRFSDRTRLIVDILGDAFFLIPFFALLAWYSWAFMAMAYGFGEQSNAGGLVDRYLVKAVLPIGSVLILMAGVGRVLRNVGLLLSAGNENAAIKGTSQ